MSKKICKSQIKILFIIVLLFFLPHVTLANTGGVAGTDIDAGLLSFDARASYSFNDEGGANDRRLRSRIHLDYAFTNWFAFRPVLEGVKEVDGSFEYDGIVFDNRFLIREKKPERWGLGWWFRYFLQDTDDKPDRIQLRFMEDRDFGKYNLRLDQLYGHDVGQDSQSGLRFENRTQFSYALKPDFTLGLESFNNFGNLRNLNGFDNQNHATGPFIRHNLKEFTYEVGYRAGMSDRADDHMFRFFVIKNF